jgi:hypothetical protein
MPSEAAFAYEVAGTVISSAIELPGLRYAHDANARWHLQHRAIPHPESGSPYHSWRHDSGDAWLLFFREGHCQRLVFPGVLDVLVAEQSGEVWCDPAPNARPGRIRQLIAHYIVPLLLGSERLVLHASAIASDDRAIAFVGSTGSGKSTLASFFCSHGALAVTDDALVVENDAHPVSVTPYAAPLRLGNETIARVLQCDADVFELIGDGTTAKRAVPTTMAADARLPLHCLYLLEPATRGRVRLSDLTKADAIRDLMQTAFEMGWDNGEKLACVFERVARLVACVPVKRLRLPHGYDQLAAAFAVVMGDAGQLQSVVTTP